MRRALIPVIAIAMSVLVSSAGSGVAAAQSGAALEAYKRGIKELERKPNPKNNAATDWRQVEAEMHAAIAASRTETAPNLGRLIGADPYLPHFFLGEALIHLGRGGEALDAFDESVKQGAINKTDHKDKLPDFYAQCQKQGYLLKEDVVRASGQLDAAKAQLQAAVSAFDELDMKNRQVASADFLSRIRAGRNAIEAADQAHRAANKSRKATDFQDALRRLNDTKDDVLRVNDEFKKYLKGLGLNRVR